MFSAILIGYIGTNMGSGNLFILGAYSLMILGIIYTHLYYIIFISKNKENFGFPRSINITNDYIEINIPKKKGLMIYWSDFDKLSILVMRYHIGRRSFWNRTTDLELNFKGKINSFYLIEGINFFGYYGADKKIEDIYNALKRYSDKLDKEFEVYFSKYKREY